MKKNLLLLLTLLGSAPVFASAETQNMWTTGKIHVVLAVLLTILGLIFIFLFVLERKISRLEKSISK